MIAEPVSPVVVVHDALAPPPHTSPPPRHVETAERPRNDAHEDADSRGSHGSPDSERLSFGEPPIVRLVRNAADAYAEILMAHAQPSAGGPSSAAGQVGAQLDVVA